MASPEDIKRLTRRSEALKSLSLGNPPQLDTEPFARFPPMESAVRQFNIQVLEYDRNLKNLLAEALRSAGNLPP